MLDANCLFFNNATSKDDDGNFDLMSIINTVDAAVRLSNLSTFVIDFDSHELLYRSKQLVYIDEATIDDQQRICANPYWSIVSEDTLEKLLIIRTNYLLVGNQLRSEEYANHVCTIDYPIILRNHELFITQKFTPLVMRNDGITKIGMFTINHSNKKVIESSIIAHSAKRFLFNFEKRQYIEYDLNMTLSGVEKAILHRARMGMTNEEIANNLYISINTVKTHRMRIFKKLQVETINEALAVIENYRLI